MTTIKIYKSLPVPPARGQSTGHVEMLLPFHPPILNKLSDFLSQLLPTDFSVNALYSMSN